MNRYRRVTALEASADRLLRQRSATPAPSIPVVNRFDVDWRSSDARTVPTMTTLPSNWRRRNRSFSRRRR
jgi:hypothetical protein